MAKGEHYKWEDVTIDDDFLNRLANSPEPIQFLTGEMNVGAQSQENLYALLGKITQYANQKFQQTQGQLKGIDSNLDPANYYVPWGDVWSQNGGAGQGTSANESAPVQQLVYNLKAQQAGLQKAQQAAQTYQQTGKIPPPPSLDEMIQGNISTWGELDESKRQKLRDATAGIIPDEVKAQANAAAARVGAPLPHKNGPMGKIDPGGAITNENVGQAYQNGQLTQNGQGLMNSSVKTPNAPGFADGGVGVKKNADGTFNFGGTSYPDQASAQAAAQNAGVTGPSSTTTTPAVTQSGTPNAASNQAYLDIINSSGLDEGSKAFLRQAASLWEPGKEINLDNVMNTFNEVKKTTIDPYFQELSNVAIDQVKRTGTFMENERKRELESEGVNADQAIRGTQNNLEARGMTFSGAGVEQLGAKSAYAQPGQNPNSAIPNQTPYGGVFAEGLVNQGNRLISSSSQARYEKNLTDLSRSAEQQLGSAASAGLVGGVSQLGGIQESAQLPGEKKQAEAGALTGIYNQNKQNLEYSKPIEPFQSS